MTADGFENNEYEIKEHGFNDIRVFKALMIMIRDELLNASGPANYQRLSPHIPPRKSEKRLVPDISKTCTRICTRIYNL
jgi:hypothetical protein